MRLKHLQATAHKESWSIFRLFNLVPLVLLIFVVSVVVWLWHRMQNPANFPIAHLKIITKGQYVPKTKIKHLVLTHLHGGFFSLDTRSLKEGVFDNSWVKAVSIRRVWPSSLVVQITERQPLLRWGSGGVLSQDGTIFYPLQETIPQNLPVVNAPVSVKDNVISSLANINAELATLGLSFTQLNISPRLAWSLVLNNGISVSLCRDNVPQRFDEFVNLYPKLISDKAQDVVSVNLCYPNGLAIHWKDGKAPKKSAYF